MHKFKYALLALPMLLAAVTHAQTAGTIIFTANQTTATSGFAPLLTWSTTPAATSCNATNAWNGVKFASGTAQQPAITSTKTYGLTCVWGNGSSLVSWTAPTMNADNSALTNLAGFKVVFGNSATTLTQSVAVNDPKATSVTIPALAAGTWYFAVRAVNALQIESADSPVVSKTITGASGSKDVTVTITTTTPPPTATLKTTATVAYDIVRSNGVRNLGRPVGTIAIGKPCESTYVVATNYYRVSAADVTITTTPRSRSIVARCAKS